MTLQPGAALRIPDRAAGSPTRWKPMSFAEIIEMPDGTFAVHRTGGDVLQTPVEFPTRAEAEEWLMRDASRGADNRIYKPGDGEGVA